MLHTGQHWDRELSEVFFEELGLAEPRLPARPAHGRRRRRCGRGSPPRSRRERPDWVLVYGDTNSTLAGAEAAADAGVPVAHVEAGLRSCDLSMPEERNRIEVDRVAALLLCPDERSRGDAARARASPGRIEVVGDVMADACLPARPDRARALERARALRRRAGRVRRSPRSTARRTCSPSGCAGSSTGLPGSRSRSSSRLIRGRGRGDSARARPGERVRTASRSATSTCPRSRLAGARDRHRLGRAAEGGVLVRRPCVTARPSTEWVDTVEVGANVLVDDDPDAARRRRRARRACRTSGRRSTATATLRRRSRPRCALALPRRETRDRHRRRRLCRRPARPGLRRGGQARRARRRAAVARRHAQPRREPHRGRPERGAGARSSPPDSSGDDRLRRPAARPTRS